MDSWVPMTRLLAGQNDALLVANTVKRGGVEIEMTVDGDVIRGLLLWDDSPSPANVKQASDGLIHRPLSDAADAHIRPRRPRRRIASLLPLV